MKYSKIPLAQTIVQLFKAKAIQHIVISPGSRNAPLTIGFTNDNYFKCYSIVDERCAAFFALGLAQQLQQPTAVVCTSGSALLNYYPAVSEAFYSTIPLLIVSADRPKYLVGIGDGQTINQPDVYKNHILYTANLKQDINANQPFIDNEKLPLLKSFENTLEKFLELQLSIQDFNTIQINKAINTAFTQKGPVHINCPFDEPLYETDTLPSVTPKVIPATINTPKNEIDYTHFASIWNNASRKLVLVGVNFPNTIHQAVLDFLANDDSVIVLTETTSNIHHKAFFPSIDKLIMPASNNELKNLQPDVLVTFGGMVVSKKIKQFLRNHKPKHHWHINEIKANDTFFVLSEFFKTSVNSFFENFIPLVTPVKSNYKPYWLAILKLRRKKHNDYIKAIPYSDFKAIHNILQSIPNHCQLQISNSSAIRYTQLFDINPTLTLFCNRGTSGIDGSTSTAIGAAKASKQQTVFITGDLSFFYDSNALWNNYIPSNFRIILINNNGGGIFRILPGEKNTPNFENFFETTHQLNASQLCNMFKIDYDCVTNEKDLNTALLQFYNTSNTPKLLEITTPRTVNDTVLLDYFKYIK